MRFYLAPFLLILAPSCATLPLPPPEPVHPTDPTLSADCRGACERGWAMSCEWAEPSPHGGACEERCASVQESGLVTWDLECRVRAPSCSAADACERK